MVAHDPDPVATTLHRFQRRAVGVGKPRRPATVVKAVAESDHSARRISRDELCKPRERRRSVVRRQQHAASCEGRTFFEMQVGDREHALLGPEQHARRVGDEFRAGDGDHATRLNRAVARLDSLHPGGGGGHDGPD
jgi:hypothetical protein